MSFRGWLRIAAPITASILGLAGLRFLAPDFMDKDTLTRAVTYFGVFAPLAYVALYTVRPLIFLPGQVLTAVGGMLFGPIVGTLCALAGSFTSMAVVFYLARVHGSKLMRRWARERYEALQKAAQKHDFTFAAIATLNPLLPTDFAVAAAAASGANVFRTLGGALLATIPGTALTAYFGDALTQGKRITAIVAAAGMIVSLVLGAIWGRRMARDVKDAATGAAEPPSASHQTVALTPP